MKEAPPARDRSTALGNFLLGIWATVIVYVAFRWITDRLDRIERAAERRSSASSGTIGPQPASEDFEEWRRKMRKQSAHELAEDLREEGLVIREDDRDKVEGDTQ